ncbi:brain-specific angiogenesis inhibitor 1-associated protein 2-like [Carcharodon carcharias]|uniref:brain-specific angiogenesis inhibitor 1-associated protein 2-like n=1 Tax=Carcharodon carcharias TaxID=13397 RepID=UPI001B7F563D|nr:brain-specific angiogenesis inhibitor 1-associated protein 2-like [Carcharodon carcharias]
MSRTEEVNKMTERVYKVVMEQFNPTLRSFVSMGKNYEKALLGVTVAAKGYFDCLVKLGELASDSQGAKDLGDTLFQMAEVHRQIQVQMEEMVKVFHSELLTQLEQKSDLDVKYLSSTLRKHQAEIRGKTDSIAKCHSELKKLRRKSQMSKNPQKYGDREMQFVEMISCMQCELDQLVAMGYTQALVEERRRYCFLVDRQCAVWRQCSLYHVKVKELLSHKLLSWQSACSDPSCIPERALTLAKQTATSSAGALTEARAPDKTLGVPTEQLGGNSLTPGHAQVLSPPELLPVANGEMNKRKSMEFVPLRVSKNLSPSKTSNSTLLPPPKPAESTSNTLPSRTGTRQEQRHSRAGEHETLTRAPATLRIEQPCVRAVFSHQAGGNETLLTFRENDIITLLVPEERDGWHYGESQVTNHKGWFPYAYTEPIQEDITGRRPSSK